LRTRIKRLLELDRSMGRKLRSKDPESRSRSSPLSLTTYFFTEISFAAMIASLASRWRRKRITKSFRATSRVVQLINPVLRGWVNYFAVERSSECFSMIQDWVETTQGRAQNRKGFGWKTVE
jgi:group II intron maturase